jgi:hypothetical protein
VWKCTALVTIFFKKAKVSVLYKEQMWALFVAIEANWNTGSMASTSELSAKFDIKGKRELRRLACSINYEVKGGPSNRDKEKGRGICLITEA